MGTALTGNTISSSYLGLIKTTDSAAISGSAKVLTDGAGNDSPLYLSTSRLGIGITPTSTLHVSGDFTLTGAFKDTSGSAGTSSYILSSTGSGTAWIANDVGDITSVVAGDGLTGGGTSGAVTINAGAGNLIDVQADQIDVDLSELTTSTSDADGDFFAVIDDANAQKKLTKGNINLSGFNNDIVSGTVGKIAKFTSTTAVGDSIVSESSSTLLIDPTGSGSPVGNIALTLLGVSGQDEQVYIYASGSSAENATIKLIPVGAGYSHIIGSGSGLRLGTSSDTDSITITSTLVEITEDVQLTGTAPNIIFNDSAVTKNIAKILGNVDSAGTNGGKLDFQTVADSGASYITALAIDDSQQVGIGTTTPSALLNLESSSTSAFLIANRTNAVDGTKNLIDFKLDASDDNSYSAGSIGVEAEGTWSSTASTRDGSIIFRPSVNGTDSAGMVLTSSFDLGVGLTSPSDYYATDVVISSNDEGGLTFASTGTTFKQYIAWADGTSGDAQYRGYIAYDHNNDSMAIATSGSAKATILSTGFTGIGETTPEAKLHVKNGDSGATTVGGASDDLILENDTDCGITIRSGNTSDGVISFADDGDHNIGQIYYSHNGNSMTFKTNDSVAATITSGGNFGLGTTNPNPFTWGNKHLTVEAAGTNQYAALDLVGSGNGAGAIIFGGGSGSGTATNIGRALISALDGSHLAFYTNASNSGASFTERMRIDSSGNVKLGSATTVTPATQADDLVIDKGATESGITIVSTSAGGIRFGDAASASVGFIEYGHTNNVMLFGANGSTSMSIKEKLVGINTTAPSFSLDVEAVDSGVQIQMGRTNTSVGSTWMGADSNGFHLGVGAYGVGNSVSAPNGFTVNSAGNFGLGTTNPTSDAIVRVLEIEDSTSAGISLDAAATYSIYSSSSSTLTFRDETNAANRMILDSSGDIDIGGTGIASCRLTVRGATDGTSDYIFEAANSSGASKFYIRNDGVVYANGGQQNNVAFGCTASPSASVQGIVITGSNNGQVSSAGSSTSAYNHWLFYNGNGLVGYIDTTGSTTTYSTSSDYRIKEDLKDFNGLDLISKMNVYDFKWKSDETRSYGAVAHEIQEIIPQAVVGEKDGEQMQGVDYSQLVPVLLKSIQELKAEIDELKKK